jgi:hypothetical protein
MWKGAQGRRFVAGRFAAARSSLLGRKDRGALGVRSTLSPSEKERGDCRQGYGGASVTSRRVRARAGRFLSPWKSPAPEASSSPDSSNYDGG